jgi:hypothetical protein
VKVNRAPHGLLFDLGDCFRVAGLLAPERTSAIRVAEAMAWGWDFRISSAPRCVAPVTGLSHFKNGLLPLSYNFSGKIMQI